MVGLSTLFGAIGALIRVTPDDAINLPNKEYWLAPARREATISTMTYMTDVELGRRSPTIDICRRICRGLGIELSAFFVALEAEGYTALQDDGTSSE